MYPGCESLKRWLKVNGKTPHSLGLEIGVDPRRIRALVNGRMDRVDTRLARAIEDVTQGAVPMQDWS